MVKLKVSWLFSCGHTLHQFESATVGVNSKSPPPARKKVNDICVECKGVENEIHLKEERNMQRKKEAIDLYHQQATTMKQHLVNAANNSEVRAEFEKMLENCQILWATKIKEYEKSNIHPPRTRISDMLCKNLKKMKEKSELMLEFEHIMCRRQERRSGMDLDRTDQLQNRCDEWRTIVAKIAELAAIYENDIAKKVDDFEGDISIVWLDALKLIKDE